VYSTIEELLDVCGMPRLEALKTLADPLERGVLAMVTCGTNDHLRQGW
jgi:hypothetical protein